MQFKLFLGLHQKFPELCESYQSSLIPPEWISNASQKQPPQPSSRTAMNQNIIGELFKQRHPPGPDSSKGKHSPRGNDYKIEYDPNS